MKLEEEVLNVVRKNRTDILHIANVLTHYARGEVLQMVWRLIALGVIKIDINFKLYLQSERETKMTKTNTRSEAARKAHETRRRNAQKRSDAARKAWATRRAQAEFERRSEAAKKAWETRRNG
jgi:hypothetical protein